MTADNPDGFPYRRATRTATAAQRRSCWDVAVGLQKAGGLETSDYMKSLAGGYVGDEQSLAEIGQLLQAHYANKSSIMSDTSFLVRFFDNMLNGAHHELHSRDLIVQELSDNPSLLRNVPPAHAIEKTGSK